MTVAELATYWPRPKTSRNTKSSSTCRGTDSQVLEFEMSRTRLCVLTACVLAAASLTVMATRHHVLGPEVKLPHGPGTWKVTLMVEGTCTGDGRVVTGVPIDGGGQR